MIAKACQVYGVSEAEILDGTHRRWVVDARRAVARTLRSYGMAYAEIGRWLGGRNHSTVIALLRRR